MVSEVIRFISLYFIAYILSFYNCCKKLIKLKSSISYDSGLDSQPSSEPDLSRFVLHLEGETALVEKMMKNNCDASYHWMLQGKKKQHKHLIQLLEKSSNGLHRVREFDSDLVQSLDCEEPPNCWSLPIATLTAIAFAIPKISNGLKKQLKSSVHQGLIYVEQIEENLDKEEDLSNIRKAAHGVWLGVDLYHNWLDIDLDKVSSQAETTKGVLEGLSDAAKERYMEFKKIYMNECLREIPSYWPVKVLAANSMYRISQTILQYYERNNNMSSDRLYEAITIMISDILGACLTNIQRIILIRCLNSSVETREESVRGAVFLLGETETVLKLLHEREIPTLSPDEKAHIDEWRSFYKRNNNLHFPPSSPGNGAVSSLSPDLQLTIV